VNERRERAARLRETGEQAAAAFHASLVGQEAHVLTEKPGTGHTEHFAPVRLAAETPAATLLRARITGVFPTGVLAEAA
jgi:threonylcarbamoyladenosine tRNA methylthiotransferase MtaB